MKSKIIFNLYEIFHKAMMKTNVPRKGSVLKKIIANPACVSLRTMDDKPAHVILDFFSLAIIIRKFNSKFLILKNVNKSRLAKLSNKVENSLYNSRLKENIYLIHS